MEKKKAIKIITATAIAASAFTAVAPAQSEAAASLTSQIKTAKATIKKPYDTFTKASTLVSSKTVNSQVQAALKAKSTINSAIKKAKLSTKAKNAYYAQIKAYDKYITYAQNYVKAYDVATKAQASLDTAVANIKAAATAGQSAEVVKQYDALKTAVASAKNAIGKTVYGSKVRALFTDKFTKAADTALAGDLKVAYDAAVEALKVPVVSAVSATNATTLTITGTGLKNLKAADITVAGNKVTAVQSADGNTATVTLQGTIPANSSVKVTVKDSVSTKDYTVNFGFAPKAVSLQTATIDDDTKDQKLTILVDGVSTSVDYLAAAGYSVQIRAWDKNNVDQTTALFGATPSTDGKFVNAALTKGDYTAQVTIAKGSTILTSDKVTFTIANTNNAATTINSADLEVNTTFVSKSNTLVVGDKANFKKVIVGAGSSLSEATSFTVKSSDPTVVSVNPTTNEVTANGLGTATLTITVGTVTKQVTVTVKGETRKVTTVTPKSSSVALIVGVANTVKYVVTDQYGDPFAAATGDINEIYPTSVVLDPASVTDATSTAAKGEGSVSLKPTTANQSGAVTFNDAKGNFLGSFVVSTTAVNNTTTKALAYDSSSKSTDDSLNGDLPSDASVTYKVNLSTSEGVANGSVTDLTDYTVQYNKDIISLTSNLKAGETDNGYVKLGAAGTFTFTAKKSGSTTLTVKDKDGNVVGTKTITVTQGAAKITGVTWKTVPTIDYNTTTFNYKSVLDVAASVSGADDIVKGITLDNTSVHAIRITSAASIYIDTNDNGTNDAGDSTLGTLTLGFNKISGLGTVTPGATAVDNVTVSNALGSVEGVLTYKVTDTVSTTPVVVGTKGVSVNVK